MVAEGKGRIWRRKDGKYFMYLPKHLAEDTAFPFKIKTSIQVKVIIDPKGKKLLIKPIASTQQTQPRTPRPPLCLTNSTSIFISPRFSSLSHSQNPAGFPWSHY